MKLVREKRKQKIYQNEETMILSRGWYLHIMHCFTHILVMVRLSGISPQRELKRNFLSFRENAYAS